MKHFVHCIETGEKPLTDGAYGLKILQIVDAMYKSAQTGKIQNVEY
jgi:predicted dehydrogenase